MGLFGSLIFLGSFLISLLLAPFERGFDNKVMFVVLCTLFTPIFGFWIYLCFKDKA